MNTFRRTLACAVLCMLPTLTAAQNDPYAAGCLLTRLDPNGDGFLSIRNGPSSNTPEIARVRNGDALYFDTRQCQGNWCYARGGSVNDRETEITGWFYTAWCEIYP